jgi:hypothetical protein
MAATVVFTFVGGVVAAAVSKVLAEELKAWTPKITRKLVALAVARLAEQQRERFSEEWSSHVAEFPGDIAKIISASGLLWAGFRIGLATRTAGPASLSDRPQEGKGALRWFRQAARNPVATSIAKLAVFLGLFEIMNQIVRRVALPGNHKFVVILGISLQCLSILVFVLEMALICLRRIIRLRAQRGL